MYFSVGLRAPFPISVLLYAGILAFGWGLRLLWEEPRWAILAIFSGILIALAAVIVVASGASNDPFDATVSVFNLSYVWLFVLLGAPLIVVRKKVLAAEARKRERDVEAALSEVRS